MTHDGDHRPTETVLVLGWCARAARPILGSMSGFDMFCERCGKRYGSEETTAAASVPLGRRLLMAVGVVSSAPHPSHHESLLRFCLACRGYSCPSCWNDDAGFCQTCVPLPEPEHVEVEPVFETIPVLAFGGTALSAPELAASQMPTFEPEQAAVEPDVVAVQHDAVEAQVEALAAEPEAVFAEPDPIPMFAELEPPVDVVYADQESFTELEPDVHWDWSLELAPEVEAEAEREPALAVEPGPGLAIEPAPPEATALPDDPIVQEAPTVPLAPVFRPLAPMGPLMPPPPPPAAAHAPRIEFELPDVPPAFVIARPPLNPALRPTLPVGLFDGPGPTVRPCPQCDLPVSARARYCRRCGSAQS